MLSLLLRALETDPCLSPRVRAKRHAWGFSHDQGHEAIPLWGPRRKCTAYTVKHIRAPDIVAGLRGSPLARSLLSKSSAYMFSDLMWCTNVMTTRSIGCFSSPTECPSLPAWVPRFEQRHTRRASQQNSRRDVTNEFQHGRSEMADVCDHLEEPLRNLHVFVHRTTPPHQKLVGLLLLTLSFHCARSRLDQPNTEPAVLETRNRTVTCSCLPWPVV